MSVVNKYIKENWHKTIKKGGRVGRGIIPLPKDFSVPSIGDDRFIDIFYWDTYFINLGLLADGFFEQAKNNLENIAFFIEKLGYMPNASHLLQNSQPPFFVRGCFDYYRVTKDREYISRYLKTMIIEYEFLESERKTATGLNQYGCSLFKHRLKDYYEYFSKRVGVSLNNQDEKDRFVRNMFAICESGWDCSYRFKSNDNLFATDEFLQIDLNCLIFDIENKISFFASELNEVDIANEFNALSKKRKTLPVLTTQSCGS